MTLQSRKNGHGWRTIIIDDDSKEKWSGNFAPTEAESREVAIDGFIQDKKDQAEVFNAQARVIERSIKKLIKMKK